VDDAAVHHVFEGGWVWVLRFNNGITSAGVAATTELANELRLEHGAAAWERLLERFPTLREQFAGAKAQFPFIHTPQLSFRNSSAAGNGWALLPSAAGFVDPLLSTGFPLTLLGITRLAELIDQAWGSERFHEGLVAYSEQTLKELDAVALMVAALYANMDDLSVFIPLSLLYFAAASFTETARRLGRPGLAGGSFLLGDHPLFGPRSSECWRRALHPLGKTEKKSLRTEIYNTLRPVDVAGFGDTTRCNWFPANANDLLKAAPKLGVEEASIQQMLARCGFVA
jgi:FADH2 O2-dependent halogenase